MKRTGFGKPVAAILLGTAVAAGILLINAGCEDDDNGTANVAGTWVGTVGTDSASMVLVQSGASVAGTLNTRGRDLAVSGTVAGSTVALVAGQNSAAAVIHVGGGAKIAGTPTPTGTVSPTPTATPTATPTPPLSPSPTPAPDDDDDDDGNSVNSVTLDGRMHGGGTGATLTGNALVDGRAATFSMTRQ